MFASTPSFWVIACSSVSLNSSIFEVSGAWGAWASRVGIVGTSMGSWGAGFLGLGLGRFLVRGLAGFARR